MRQFESIQHVFTERFPDYFLSETFCKSSLLYFYKHLSDDCITKAMQDACSKMKNPDEAIRYFCGICWRSIRQEMDHKPVERRPFYVSGKCKKALSRIVYNFQGSKGEYRSLISLWFVAHMLVETSENADDHHSIPMEDVCEFLRCSEEQASDWIDKLSEMGAWEWEDDE